MSISAISLLVLIVFNLTDFLVFYSSLRCILWLFECYDTKNKCSEDTSAHDIIEYFIVPVFLKYLIMPLKYLPIPFIHIIIYYLCTMIGIFTTIDSHYRKKLCLTIKYMFVNVNYNKGSEQIFHKSIQMIVYIFNCINSYILNIINNPTYILNKLNDVNTISDALKIATTIHTINIDSNINDSELEDLSDGNLDDNYN
jgi:hypothetical protein